MNAERYTWENNSAVIYDQKMGNNRKELITAIMGGTFDPVHLGHMSFAMDVLMQTEVQKIVFMPAKLQPFKLDAKISSYEDRAAMLALACAAINDQLMNTSAARGKAAEVSLLENELPGVSYTYRTLEEYKKRMEKIRACNLRLDEGQTSLYFITGTDSFVKLDTWKEHEKLLGENSFIVGIRPNYPVEEIFRKKAEYEEKYGTKSLIIKNTPVDLSATEIRRQVSEGLSIEGMVTESVAEYIRDHGLYSD